MSEPQDPNPRELKFAVYLRRFSRVTRIIGILAVLGSMFSCAVAMDMRSDNDQLAFALMSGGILLFGTLVWATGVFHGAVSSALPTLASLDFKLERTLRMLAAQREPREPREPRVFSSSAPTLPAGPETDAPGETRSAPIAKPPPPPKVEPPPPVKVPCPSCSGLVHPEASRCVHCMKKIQLEKAS